MLCRTQLSQYSMANPPVTMLNRCPETQAKYDKFRSKNSNRKEFITNMKINLSKCDYYYVPNDFPYYTQDNIEHWVCWYSADSDPEKIMDNIKKTNNVITYWKNYSFNMSIQEINHLHVFIEK